MSKLVHATPSGDLSTGRYSETDIWEAFRKVSEDLTDIRAQVKALKTDVSDNYMKLGTEHVIEVCSEHNNQTHCGNVAVSHGHHLANVGWPEHSNSNYGQKFTFRKAPS